MNFMLYFLAGASMEEKNVFDNNVYYKFSSLLLLLLQRILFSIMIRFIPCNYPSLVHHTPTEFHMSNNRIKYHSFHFKGGKRLFVTLLKSTFSKKKVLFPFQEHSLYT